MSRAREVLDQRARRDYERRTDTLLDDVLRDVREPEEREPLGSVILRLRAREDGRGVSARRAR